MKPCGVSALQPRDLGIAFSVAVLALLLRSLVFIDVSSLPTFEFTIGDARSYTEWAGRIAEGDWWGDRVFYQAPAYPYFLALVRVAAGADQEFAVFAQIVLGSLSCALLLLATTLFLGRGAGLAAGLLLALYPSAIFFDLILQKASLGLFLLCALLFALARFQAVPGSARVALGGLALAALALTRENALAFAVVVPVWIVLAFRTEPMALRARWAAAFLLALLLPLACVGARNQAVGGTFAITTSQLGPNFYIGNNPGATGVYKPLIPGRETPEFEGSDAAQLAEEALGRELTAGEVSSYWLDRSLDFIVSEPLAWVLLTVNKGLLAFHRFEVPDYEDVYLFADHSPLLRTLHAVLHFGILLPLAVAGMVLGWQRGARVGLLHALFWVFTASLVAFYLFARYRFPMVPLLVPFAGFAIAETVATVRRGEAVTLRAPLAAALVALVLANLPIVNEAPLRATSHFNMADMLIQNGRPLEAEPFLVRAEAIYPDNPDLQLRLALVQLERGRRREAVRHLEHALRLAPEHPGALELQRHIHALRLAPPRS